MTGALSIRRQLVGSCLRRYRENLGYDLGVPARILDCHPSKISRIETGQRGIRPKELRELLTEYGVDASAQDALAVIARRAGDPIWRDDHDPALGSAYADFLDIEKTATAIFTYAPVQVPALLQTLDYARAVICADPNVPEQARTVLAAAWLDRQQAVLHQRRTSLTALIGEAALRQHAGTSEVTRAQLRHLADVSASCPQVCIRILPFTAGEHASGAGFTVLQFSQVPAIGLVHIDGPAGGTCLDTPSAVTACTTAFTAIQLHSLTRQDSASALRVAAAAQGISDDARRHPGKTGPVSGRAPGHPRSPGKD
jgi:hypothetical protein